MMSVEKKNGVLYAADWAGDASKVWDESYNNFLDSKADTDLKELADKVNEVIAANLWFDISIQKRYTDSNVSGVNKWRRNFCIRKYIMTFCRESGLISIRPAAVFRRIRS